MHAAKCAARRHLSGYFCMRDPWQRPHSRPEIKVIVTLILTGVRRFIPGVEQIAPASSCDQDFSSFLASLNRCHCCAGLLLTELIYYQLVFLW